MTRSPSPRIALIGLGRMGTAVAGRLVAGGLTVLGHDRRPEARAAAVAAGAEWAGSAGEAVAGAGVVITLLPGPPEVEAVCASLAGALTPGAVWIEMSSATPGTALRTAAAAAAGGAHVLDAPVGGSPDDARHGRLICFVGGDASDVAATREVLDTLAHRVVHIGPAGAGYTVKLLANALWFGQAVAVAEALAVAVRSGLDPETVRAALSESAAASRFLEDAAPALLRGEDLTTFSLARCRDQLAAVLALGAERSVPLELTAAVEEVHRAALERYGPVDGELLAARLVAERAGVRFTPDPPSA
jgi:3-hydroxyisobutyrate dehydrogenase